MSDANAQTRWILVAGSGNERIPATIVETSKRLGLELAGAGFGLVSGGWPGVDHIVARSFARSVKESGGRLADRLMQVVEQGRTPDFPAGRLLTAGSDTQAWEASIANADAIALIGGIGGTYETGRIARRQGKPVLPLADTREGGHSDAYRFYFEMVQGWDAEPVAGLTLGAFQSLADPGPDVASELVRLLETLFGQQAHRVTTPLGQRQPNRDAALELWAEKLAFLLKEEPLTVDPSQRFRLKKEIEEAQERIRELKA